VASKILQANQASGSKPLGSRTLERASSGYVPPGGGAAPAQQRAAPQPAAPPVPTGPGGVTGQEPTRVNGQVSAPPGALSALNEEEFAARRQQASEFGAEAGRLARDADARAETRPVVDRRNTSDGPSEFPFPMGPGGAGETGENAIDLAARVTNTPRAYLRAVASQEGNDDPNARNPRSSATGLFQFTEGTWLQMMRDYGQQYGLPQDLRDAIQTRSNGAPYVADAAARDRIMALRTDSEWSALMGGQLFHREASTIQRAVGRPITVADVYLGHFLGGDAAGYWLQQIQQGHGSRNARETIRRYHARRPGAAQQIIDQNPRQFAEGVTVAQLYRMQIGDLIAHGERRGIPASELRAVVQTIAPGPKPTSGGKQIMRPSEIVQGANRRDWTVRQGEEQSEGEARVNPETGETELPLREQRREATREEKARDEEAIRRNRRSVTLRRNGARFVQPF